MNFKLATIELKLVTWNEIVLAQIYLSKAFDNVDLDAPQFTQSLHYENVEKTLQQPALAHGQDNRLQAFVCTLLIIVNCQLNWETGVPQGSVLCPSFLLVLINNLCCLSVMDVHLSLQMCTYCSLFSRLFTVLLCN